MDIFFFFFQQRTSSHMQHALRAHFYDCNGYPKISYLIGASVENRVCTLPISFRISLVKVGEKNLICSFWLLTQHAYSLNPVHFDFGHSNIACNFIFYFIFTNLHNGLAIWRAKSINHTLEFADATTMYMFPTLFIYI